MRPGPSLPKECLDALEGVDHEFIHGRRHWKILINGRLAAVWPHGKAAADMSQGTKKMAAQLRRAARGEYSR